MTMCYEKDDKWVDDEWGDDEWEGEYEESGGNDDDGFGSPWDDADSYH